MRNIFIVDMIYMMHTVYRDVVHFCDFDGSFSSVYHGVRGIENACEGRYRNKNYYYRNNDLLTNSISSPDTSG